MDIDAPFPEPNRKSTMMDIGVSVEEIEGLLRDLANRIRGLSTTSPVSHVRPPGPLAQAMNDHPLVSLFWPSRLRAGVPPDP
jgi:hypothetical protein